MLRPEFVERKLQLIAEELARLTDFRDISYDELIGDALRLAAVERILERVVLRAIDVNEHLLAALARGQDAGATRLTYRDTFLKLVGLGVYDAEFGALIAGSAGLRNVLVHEYNDIDHRIVHGSLKRTLDEYTTYIERVGAFLSRHLAAEEARERKD